MIAAPLLGRFVAHFGERRTLIFEYAGLALVFALYGGIYWFGWGVLLAAVLYVVDHLFFAFAIAQKSYFQKIADPKDVASTAGVSFSINHIAAVVIPALLGIVWLTSPQLVFYIGAGFAICSLILALIIPTLPGPGREVRINTFGWANATMPTQQVDQTGAS